MSLQLTAASTKIQRMHSHDRRLVHHLVGVGLDKKIIISSSSNPNPNPDPIKSIQRVLGDGSDAQCSFLAEYASVDLKSAPQAPLQMRTHSAHAGSTAPFRIRISVSTLEPSRKVKTHHVGKLDSTALLHSRKSPAATQVLSLTICDPFGALLIFHSYAVFFFLSSVGPSRQRSRNFVED